jgi:hypothetical protein
MLWVDKVTICANHASQVQTCAAEQQHAAAAVVVPAVLLLLLLLLLYSIVHMPWINLCCIKISPQI